jgi:large subunit ribosomal protein L9
MEVLLRQKVAGLGLRGDIVKVADGYARNYLLPKGIAIVANDRLVEQARVMKQRSLEHERLEREQAEELAGRLASVELVIEARASKEGRLFGSVTPADIAERLSDQAGVTIERKQIRLEEPIKELGTHSVPVRVHPEVEVAVMVTIASKQ